MAIQIFGKSKCFDTKKAERWFKERNVKVQQIDILSKGLSRGEFDSVVKALGGIEAVIDTSSKDYCNIKYLLDEAKFDKLTECPKLYKTPIVRCGKMAAVGYKPEKWEEFIESEKGSEHMTALVTGASSGIGREIARELAARGVRLIISGRNKEALQELRNEIGSRRVKIITADLRSREECFKLYEQVKPYNVNILINNAGFGVFGRFAETGLERELDMLDVNISAMHILMKLFLRDFRERNSGYILNVASSAGFMAGPYMAAYYSSKNYVVRMTEAVYEELRCENSSVYVGALCPGPVDTNFNSEAGVKFNLKGISAEYAAECAVRGMLERKTLIIPTFAMKAAVVGASLVPPLLLTKITRRMQSRKGIDYE